MKKTASSLKRAPAKDVDAYLASAPKELRPVLENLRQAIKAVAPKAEEVISYQIPTYKYHGPLVHFMARASHCSFITVNKEVLKKFKAELENFDTSGTTIHFTAENPLPAALVKKIVKARVAENEAQAKLKRK
ncbi:MAG: DUF1801 domain-containing protein [candidate division KSB1 bacterium]|nr:DUF1801 domain-containing protein [candidate division KSB1 bacterium]MDZ7274151.1 DUF1801 domain-containing protein [candidate division KSB1 bacterium]MDZ7287804.1 DUF1801 domain-containing protein [candidate division KSB1 bacterium]MDZ7296750.1 DUF1801 domain-containing protein [candidate division KSB1 bacterium]MDZ7347616.1 DUF1801 domain-containing protein [candidate division KSB1 bacterium]